MVGILCLELYCTFGLAYKGFSKIRDNLVVCLIYLSEGRVPTLWDAIFDIKTKKFRNCLGFNTSVFIVYVSNG